ncbi:MAG TPA: NAD(+) diphosphatase [Clostridiaceae bacterium]
MRAESYITFIPGITNTMLEDEDLCFIFYKGQMLTLEEPHGLRLIKRADFKKMNLNIKNSYYIGLYNNKACFAMELSERIDAINNISLKDLRTTGQLLGDELFSICGKAYQTINFYNTHKYCGICGEKTILSETERAVICPNCGNVNYPNICPAIIVAITKGDEILLAHNKKFNEGMYSIIAGFVEVGETFEDCVKREVMEEVGIKVKNIKFFTSQPWPFPNSLMIGYTAEYLDGEIKVDGEEITQADWFNINNLPMLPSKISIARKLIDSCVDHHSKL